MNLLFAFTLIGVWELCKLSGVIEKLSGGASIKPTDYLEDGIRTIPKGAVNATGIADLSGSKYISEDFFEKNITSHVHTNNLVTSLRDLVPSAPNMGRIVRIEGDEEQFLMPQGVYKLELFEGMDGDFLISFSNSDKYRKIISAEKNGSTQVHIRNGEFLNIDINLPSKYEQKKIGAFFKQLDDTITLHQRKLEQLKELKKTYLQVMFPRKDERVPKLRFADFEGEWAQRKLGEISTHRSGTAIERYFTEDGKYKVISIGSYGTDSKYVDQGIRAISNEITNARVVHKGELTMVLNDKTSDGAIIGRSLLIESEEEYVINQRTEIISPKDDFNVNFAYTTLNNTFRQKVKKIVQGGTQIYVNYPAVKNLMLDFPSYKEQTKIGTFFKQFDDTITLHQNKLDQLKTLKKTYLQNMFI